ncbi:S24 family peptidase [Shewanella sp. D64]|uniref:S24 family peptidase n=1 Tax=unclassified Shewanella TaxID=196818 RepID=UPI0022BA7082|nr:MULTISPECIES: S24 family peptidase [unclassified Shewanella]MEC4725658.1 S24 family peptidase [Shewanella sp. D64]MEC4737735.1 S24 family peptidase [Shewanella sp. E94]WBJ93538.1 S24 family peptidase [Shewanella sp. MTB7]
MALKDDVLARVGTLVGSRSLKKAAIDWDIPQSTLHTMINDRREPKLHNLELICKNEGVSIEWLMTGAKSSLVKVPEYDLRASAGHGCFVIAENPIAEFSFSQDWLVKQGLSKANLCVVSVCGDSMEPTLIDEDLMLVKLIDDPSQGRDGICVIRIDDEIMVKRIQFDFIQNGYHVSSDNTAYKSFFVGSDFDSRFTVVGRLVRVLQRAKQPI